MSSLKRVGHRIVPGSETRVSELGIALDPDPVPAPSIDRPQVGALRRARALGITLYDLAGARSSSRAEWLLRTAFPEPDAGIVVVVGLGAGSSAARPRAAAARRDTGTEGTWSEASVRAWLAEVRPRLPPGTSIVPEIRLRSWEGREMRPAAALGPLAAQREVVSWSTRVDREILLAGAPIDGLGSPIVSTELSLLDAPALAPIAGGLGPSGPSLLVRDPFAGGRLDGSLFAQGIGDRRAGQPPRELRELREEFAPVLRLGFLTRQRKRTLAMAALRYLLQRAETLSVLVPLPPPERWEEIFSAAEAAPLDSEELALLEGAGPDPRGGDFRGPGAK